MRADRLLSIQLILQARGRVTASALAEELGVTVRTIYRDIDALSSAGVPVYTLRGPQGGCALLEDYRTNLTGLKPEELRALFMMNIPAALADLGVVDDFRSAFLKVTAAASREQRQQQVWIQQRLYLDWEWWSEEGRAVPPLLPVMQEGVWQDRRMWIMYQRQLGPEPEEIRRLVDPYSLVAKAGSWYLVCASDGRLRVYALSQIRQAALDREGFQRPSEFDLPRFWADWCAREERKGRGFEIRVRISPLLQRYLPRALREHIRGSGTVIRGREADAWWEYDLVFESLDHARSHCLAYGGAMEVLQPEALRLSVADYAAQIVKVYNT